MLVHIRKEIHAYIYFVDYLGFSNEIFGESLIEIFLIYKTK